MPQKENETIRFIDLCAGLGGFHRGLHQVDLPGVSFKCVFASELDDELRTVYPKNFEDLQSVYAQEHGPQLVATLKNAVNAGTISPSLAKALPSYDKEGALTSIHGDLFQFVNMDEQTLVPWDEANPSHTIIPDHDLLCAGFPCQPFSKSGDQKGFSDADRGNVFYAIWVIIKQIQPTYVLLENVGNFPRHNDGETWNTVKEILGNNYEIVGTEQVQQNPNGQGLLSLHQLGEPYHRERFFIVAQHKTKARQALTPYPLPSNHRGATDPDQDIKEKEATAKEKLLNILIESNERASDNAEIYRQLHEEAQLTTGQVDAIVHWNTLLQHIKVLKQRQVDASQPVFTMPSSPIWGYELDPWNYYPYEEVDSPPVEMSHEELKQYRQERKYKLPFRLPPPKGTGHNQKSRKWVRSVKDYKQWLADWPKYAKRHKWPQWKSNFVRDSREWGQQLWSGMLEHGVMNEDQIRNWLDTLYAFSPSFQKLEWNCKDQDLELWEHILQLRPSGIRVKRAVHVLVAMTTTQLPIVPRPKGEALPDKADPRSGGRFILQSEALQVQGFPSDWALPPSKGAAFKAFGNAVHVTVVQRIVEAWMGGGEMGWLRGGRNSISSSGGFPQ